MCFLCACTMDFLWCAYHNHGFDHSEVARRMPRWVYPYGNPNNPCKLKGAKIQRSWGSKLKGAKVPAM